MFLEPIAESTYLTGSGEGTTFGTAPIAFMAPVIATGGTEGFTTGTGGLREEYCACKCHFWRHQ